MVPLCPYRSLALSGSAAERCRRRPAERPARARGASQTPATTSLRARAEAWLDPRPAGSWLHHGFHRLGSESWGRKRKKTKSMGTIETAGPVAFRLLSSPSSVDLLLPASLSPVAWSCAFWPGRASRWRLAGAAAA